MTKRAALYLRVSTGEQTTAIPVIGWYPALAKESGVALVIVKRSAEMSPRFADIKML